MTKPDYAAKAKDLSEWFADWLFGTSLGFKKLYYDERHELAKKIEAALTAADKAARINENEECARIADSFHHGIPNCELDHVECRTVIRIAQAIREHTEKDK